METCIYHQDCSMKKLEVSMYPQGQIVEQGIDCRISSCINPKYSVISPTIVALVRDTEDPVQLWHRGSGSGKRDRQGSGQSYWIQGGIEHIDSVSDDHWAWRPIEVAYGGGEMQRFAVSASSVPEGSMGNNSEEFVILSVDFIPVTTNLKP